jgi:hypothetical protein
MARRHSKHANADVVTSRKPAKRKNYEKLIEKHNDYAWQKRLAWLRRPRLHTAVFAEAYRDEQIAAEWAKRGVVPVEPELFEQKRANQAKRIEQVTKNLGWSNERLALFKQFVVAYSREPTIQNYVRVRRSFPEVEIEVSQFAGIDALFAFEDKYRAFGIDPALIAAALDADEPSIDALCLHLLELLIARGRLPKDGPKHIEKRRNAISDSIVNYLISQMLEAFDWHQETFRIPASLVVLIRHQLCGVTPDLHEEYLSRERRHKAAHSLGQRLKPNERLSINRVAAMLAIPRSTAARWLTDKDFQHWVEAGRKWAAEGGVEAAIEAFKKRLDAGD